MESAPLCSKTKARFIRGQEIFQAICSHPRGGGLGRGQNARCSEMPFTQAQASPLPNPLPRERGQVTGIFYISVLL